MKARLFLITASTISLLSACGGDPDLSNKVSDLKSITQNLKVNSKDLKQAHGSLAKAFKNVNSVSDNLEKRAKQNQATIEKSIELQKQAFLTFSEKISRLEKLYISEGVIELTNDDGKINLERFPSTSQTNCEFIEELSSFSKYAYSFSGRVQSDGSWKINGKDYKLLDNMTFQVQMKNTPTSHDAGRFTIKKVTFKNSHGELVTTSDIYGYLLSDINKDQIKWSTREVNDKKQGFIPKRTKCKVVLEKPLNLGLRK